METVGQLNRLILWKNIDSIANNRILMYFYDHKEQRVPCSRKKRYIGV